MPASRHSTRAAAVALAVLLTAGLPRPGDLPLGAPPATAQEAVPSIEEATEGMERLDGFVPVRWSEEDGTLHLVIDRFDEELLYVEGLSAGVGSNDIGLDRGQLGAARVVEFRRVGPKILLVEPNHRYRASSDNPAEERAVREAFAESVLWGFRVEAESDGRVLVDATDFVVRDAHDVVGTLRRTGQGSFGLDESRSAPYLPRTKAFPENTELEATLTFTGDDPGGWLRSVTPTPGAVTVRQHHSFVKLPPRGEYEPRAADPRSGFNEVAYADYAVPIHEPREKRLIARHRLEKADPSADVSEPVEPIVYHLDRGTPEPIRSALLEGARWWNRAFGAAGYRNAFRVEMMPEGADPMDLRYNVIQWVHRSTRGWSYGRSVVDPRTGEILKGHVTLGSLRVRQDHLIAEGLLSPYEEGTEVPPEPTEMALARLRQLSAHEVGHTLGLRHNYIASTLGRASVMDYPHPLVKLADDGSIDLSDAYDTGIGEWDEVAIRYGYADFPEGTDVEAALDGILADARAAGITYLTDADARPAGSAHPRVHLWDNGKDAARELERVMAVRRAALDDFGEEAIRKGWPLAKLEEALVPLYLHHRYQVEAATKVVGGLYYDYALRGDGQRPTAPVPREEQLRALDAVLGTLDPAELALPDDVLGLIPPRPPGHPRHRELFTRYTGLTFDPVAPAVPAADHVLSLLLHPERAARLVQQEAFDPEMPGFADVLDRTTATIFEADVADGYEAEISRAIRRVYVERLMGLAADAEMAQVRAVAAYALEELRGRLAAATEAPSRSERAHAYLLAGEIRRFQERPAPEFSAPRPLDAPPGSPIGTPGRAGASGSPLFPYGGFRWWHDGGTSGIDLGCSVQRRLAPGRY